MRLNRVAGPPVVLFIAVFMPLAASAAEWTSVARSDRTEVFVNEKSLKWAGPWLSLRTRQAFVEPQPSAKQGKTYLSARNEFRIDCGQRRLAYKEIEAYALADLQGDIVQKTKVGEKTLKWMDAPTGTVFGELVDYACQHAPAAPPATIKP